MEFLIGVFVGAVGASAGWFFVWKNNKDKIQDLASQLAAKIK
jgi:beta-lactam-binding protein with PASTA domain